MVAAPPTSAQTTVRLPAAERREQLLRVARRVLADRGFYQTTMADIADFAGVTKPVLYQHFGSKRDLYAAVLEDVGQRLGQAVIESASDADSPRAQVEAGLRAYVNFVETDADGFRILFSGTSRQDPEWAAFTSELERSLALSIAELILIEGVPHGHRLTLAHGVLGLAEGMMRFWLVDDHEALDREALLKDLTDLAWGGLRGIEAS